MRLPRPLRRLLDPHTALITGLKSALRAGDGQQMRSVIHTSRRRLGLNHNHTERLIAALVGRLDDSVSHEEVSRVLRRLGESIPASALSATTWLTLENLSRTVGCFAASETFTNHALSRMRASGIPRAQYLAALHSRDLPGARDVWESRRSARSPFWMDAGHYLWWWSHGQSGRFHPSPDSRFVEAVRGHTVTVLGPAPTNLGRATVDPDTRVARVIMQEVLTWSPDTDPLGGQCDLAYASRETRNWISRHLALGRRRAIPGGEFPPRRKSRRLSLLPHAVAPRPRPPGAHAGRLVTEHDSADDVGSLPSARDPHHSWGDNVFRFPHGVHRR